jgi:predicted porin
MKKSLIALAALSAFATAAQAQSSVSVYGTYDLGYQSTDYTNVGGLTATTAQRKASGINSGGASGNGALTSNRLGFRGTEDLGGGLKASFNYELGFSGANVANDSTTSAASLNTAAARESNVTLSGGFGAVKIGYGLTLVHGTVAGLRAISGSNMVGDLSYTSDSISSADSRIHANMVRSNGVTYYTPTVNGFNAALHLGKQEDKTDAADSKEGQKNTGVQVNYAAGGLKLSAATQTGVNNIKAVTGVDASGSTTAQVLAVSAAETKTKVDAFSAQYTMGAVTFDALFAKNEATNKLTGAQSSKNDVTQVGVKYVVGKTTLAAQYGWGEGEGANASTAQRDRKGYQVAAIYGLSNRTNIYAAIGEQESKYVNAATNGVAGTVEKAQEVAIGVRHSF